MNIPDYGTGPSKYISCLDEQYGAGNHIEFLGLFTADQKLRGGSSKYTRQNPNGNRYGYECAEERDYYPYWHPTDWIDIAVLANKKKDCSFYQRESFNVKPKGIWHVDHVTNLLEFKCWYPTLARDNKGNYGWASRVVDRSFWAWICFLVLGS